LPPAPPLAVRLVPVLPASKNSNLARSSRLVLSAPQALENSSPVWREPCWSARVRLLTPSAEDRKL
ncbi:MAG: hypothetical protein WBE97_06545, partial [Candidatus Acidiferrales bacterium]